eukprot:5038968-Lingulodinium_polyedra.AAC.1
MPARPVPATAPPGVMEPVVEVGYAGAGSLLTEAPAGGGRWSLTMVVCFIHKVYRRYALAGK